MSYDRAPRVYASPIPMAAEKCSVMNLAAYVLFESIKVMTILSLITDGDSNTRRKSGILEIFRNSMDDPSRGTSQGKLAEKRNRAR
jgi:hypothetical protein